MEFKGTLIWLIIAATIFAISMTIKIKERRARKKRENEHLLQKS